MYNSKRSRYIFSAADGSRINYDRVLRQFHKDQASASVKILGLHGLRHTFASHFVMKGGQILELKAILGHSDITTTERYVHLAPDYLKNKSKVVEWSPNSQSNLEEINSPELSPNFDKKKISENLSKLPTEEENNSKFKDLTVG